MRMLIVCLLMGAITAGCMADEAPEPAASPGAADDATPAPPDSGAVRRLPPVTQPTDIPGEWKLVDLPLPPFDEIRARPVATTPVYGLYTWCGEYREHRESILKVGWRSIRIGGPLDDETMKMLCKDGVEVMKTLGLRDVNPSGEKKNRAAYDADEPFIRDYVQGVERFLERYGPGGTFFKERPGLPELPITYVEIWNEPNFQYMIPDREPRAEVEAERAALYAKILPGTCKAIKARWPTVNVVGFGAGGASKGDIRFIRDVHKNAADVARSYDVLSTHPYCPPVAPEAFFVKPWGGYDTASSLKEIRDILAGHDRGDARIWYTEVGWPISKADGGHFDTDPKKTFVSPLLQAAYVCRQYAMTMRLGVERSHVMFCTDSDGFNGGFFLRDKSWRPSATAVGTMIRLMPNPKLMEAISDGKDGLFAYGFVANADPNARQAPQQVIMAWNVAGPKTVELPAFGKELVVIDLFGNSREVEATDDKVSVEVGPCPVYVMSRKRAVSPARLQMGGP